MSYGEKIAKNAVWLIAATTLNKVIAFAAFYVIARLTGPTITGVYFYGVSVTSVFVILSDLGMTPVLIRAVAGKREDAAQLFGAAFRLKAILAPVAILAALAYGVLNGVDQTTMATIGVACLVMTADTFHLALYGALRGRQNLKIEAVGMLVGQILTTCAAISAAIFRLGPPGLAAALLLGSLWNVFWALLNTRQLQVKVLRPGRADYRHLMHEAIPFGISGVAVKVYSYVDSLLIHAYQGATTVGLYSVAYKMTYALQFLPLTFSAALYPALANAWANKDHDALKRSFVESMRFLAAVGFMFTAALSALAPRLITTFYGAKYLGSIAPLEILPWVLLPIFMDFPVGSLLNATHRAHLKTSAMVGTMVVNVILNVILVPSMGPTGAAWAGVFSFWFLFLVGAYFAQHDAGGWKPIMSILFRGFIAAIISWAAWRIVGDLLPLFAAAVFGGAVAIIAGFVLRLIKVDDLRFIMRLRSRSITENEDVHAES